MTSFLIDSHIWLWMLADDRRLRPRTRAIVADTDNVLLLSIASVWELAIKAGIGRLRGPLSTDREIRSGLAQSGVDLLGVELGDAAAVRALPPHHGDPFDRMIVVQAQRRGIPLITADARLGAYDVEVIAD